MLFDNFIRESYKPEYLLHKYLDETIYCTDT